jgi:Na+-transporting NADH:ubiquinone oxidoreductase subunit C
VSEQQSNVKTILFMVVLSFACAIILSLLASALAEPKDIARELDRSKQMMIAAKILDHKGHFLVQDNKGDFVPAKFDKDGVVVPGSPEDRATQAQLLQVYQKRIVPMLVDNQGNLKTFKEANINEDDYTAAYKKTGYYRQPQKLIYKVLPNDPKANENSQAEAWVIPVNGFGLWDAIYGYLAIKPDGNTVIGTTWYEQKETPGLGGNIAEPFWQDLFPNKKIFQESADGKTDTKYAPLGITVVKGKVAEVLGSSPKAKSAVDGMTGATLTGNGVTDAYRDVLAPYRPFLIKISQENQKT